MTTIFAALLSIPLRALIALRNAAYDKKLFNSFRLKVKVISVGNLSLGGSGKTPVCDFILKLLQEYGLKPALLSRGYAGQVKDMEEIPMEFPRTANPIYFGDEPAWLANQHPKVPIMIGGDRVKCGQALLKLYPDIDVIIIDDGFQHRRIQRDCNIVVIDATESIKNYNIFPYGRSREPISSLKRADILIFTKLNLLPLTNRASFREQWINRLQSINCATLSIWEMNYTMDNLEHLTSGKLRDCESFKEECCLLVSGIGNSAAFENLVKQKLKIKVVDHLSFQDHCSYNQKIIAAIIQSFKKTKAQIIITSEKDGIKLKMNKDLADLIWITKLKLQPLTSKEQIYEDLCCYL